MSVYGLSEGYIITMDEKEIIYLYYIMFELNKTSKLDALCINGH